MATPRRLFLSTLATVCVVGGAALAAPKGSPIAKSHPPIVGRVLVTTTDPDEARALPFRAILQPIGAPAKTAPTLADGDGNATLEVPPGRYRLTVTRGLEYSIASREVTVTASDETAVAMELRRVVDASTVAACDFHVHARGSFDSRVPLDVRVRSLLAAGFDFAVPSEHNKVGHYPNASGPSHRVLAWVPGIEVTKRWGHVNVFPYSSSALPALRKRGGFPHLIAVVREESPRSLIQLNHPRLRGMGFFQEANIDTHKEESIAKLPRGFDLLEVYSGKQVKNPSKVEEVLGDWERLLEAGRHLVATSGSDGHSEAPTTLGFPRTYVTVPGKHDLADAETVNADAVIDGLRLGHAFVTSGPLVFVSQGTAGPGDKAVVDEGGNLTVHVRVAVAPWIDVRDIELHAGGVVIGRASIAARDLDLGEPSGDLADLRRKSIVFDADLSGKIPRGARASFVVVRGRAPMSDAVPTLSFPALAFSNPMFL